MDDEQLFLTAVQTISKENGCKVEFDLETNTINFRGSDEDCIKVADQLQTMFPNRIVT